MAPGDSSHEDDVDALLARCVEAPSDCRDELVERLCAEHPSAAPELRARLRLLAAIGLTEPVAPVPEFPAQLGDFRLATRLGGGGMGVVYLAEQLSLRREVALKLIRPEHLWFPGARARFQREVFAAAQLQHPGIVRVHCVGEENGIPFFAMERVHGCALADVLAHLRAQAPERLGSRDFAAALAACSGGDAAAVRDLGSSWVDACFTIAADVASALAYAHEHGVVHRDLKPANVMLSMDGRPVLVDFGLSSRSDGGKLTRAGTMLGSLAYMSPEQVRGEAADARADVYGLGVTLYEMLTLRDAYAGESAEDIRRQVLDGAVRQPRALNRKIPPDAETVCLHAMTPERGRRYQTMAALHDDLRAFLQRRPIRARRPGPVLRTRRLVQRHPTTAALLALAVLGLGVLPSALLLHERTARRRIEAQRDVAERVQRMLVEAFELADPHAHLGREPSAKDLLDRAVARVRADAALPAAVRAPLLRALGRAHAGLGSWQPAEELLRAYLAEADAAERASAESFLARDRLAEVLVALGHTDEADAVIAAAIAQWRATHGEETSVLPALLLTRAGVCGNAGDLAGAEEHTRAALALLRHAPTPQPVAVAESTARLAEIVAHRDADAAVVLSAEALRLLREHGLTEHPTMVTALRLHGRVLTERGDGAGAVAALNEALATGARIYAPDHTLLVESRQQLALALALTGDLAAARSAAETAIAAHRQRSGDAGRHGLLRALTFLGSIQFQQRDLDGALATYRESLELARELHGAHAPITLDAHCNLGRALVAAGDDAAAIAEYEAALAGHEATGRCDESAVYTRCDYAAVLQGSGDHDAAVEHAARAVALSRAALPQPHHATVYASTLLGVTHANRGDFAAARTAHEAALAVDAELGPRRDPALAAQVHRRLADCCEQLGDVPAEIRHREALVALRRAATGQPDLGPALLTLARALTRGGRDEDAIAVLTEARGLAAQARDALHLLGAIHRRRGDTARLHEAAAALHALGESR